GSRDERMLPPESSRAELTIVRIMDDGSDPGAYLDRIETHLATLASDVSTWMIVCPMTRIPVTGSWNVNQWLETNHYLARTEDGGVDMTRTRVFYAGENEPGLRINRELTYARGIVPRIDYEGLRKTVATELRSVSVPGTGNTSPGNEAGLAMFTKLFAGEQIYINRTEGRFPDIVWEQSDPSVAVVTELQTVPPTRLIPGGWMLLYGSPFDHALQDTTRLDDLLAADVTPTVLYLLRLPVARDMDGRVLRPLMEATQHRSVPVVIDSYTVSDTLVDQGVMESSTEGNGTTRQ
nr:hypothetical protein [bacterium]